MTFWMWCKIFLRKQELSKLNFNSGEVAPNLGPRPESVFQKSSKIILSRDEQLRGWLAGEPKHDWIHNFCVPDSSCCHPELIAPKQVRQAYMMANEMDRAGFITMFSRRLNVKILKNDTFTIIGEQNLTRH